MTETIARDAIEIAVSDVQEILRFLVAQMIDKGYEKPGAELEIGATGAIKLNLRTNINITDGHAGFVTSWGGRYAWDFLEGHSFAEVLSKAHAAIRDMEEHPARAMAAWFDPQHPMNRADGETSLRPTADGGESTPSMALAATPSESDALVSQADASDGGGSNEIVVSKRVAAAASPPAPDAL